LLLFGAAIAIGWDAIGKFNNPEPVAGNQIMIVAAIGVVINTITALLFMKGQKEDLNIKGAFLHMAADAGISLGVVIAGLLILTTNFLWIDPVMSLLIIAVILWSTWKLFIDAINLALDAVPKNININEVKDFLVTNKDVENVHDLHVWALSTSENALSAHVIALDNYTDQLLVEIQNGLRKKFGIVHTTIQIEKKDQNDLNCINCD
jgi:cobalt-zinc-cadmium efflux system protein